MVATRARLFSSPAAFLCFCFELPFLGASDFVVEAGRCSRFLFLFLRILVLGISDIIGLPEFSCQPGLNV